MYHSTQTIQDELVRQDVKLCQHINAFTLMASQKMFVIHGKRIKISSVDAMLIQLRHGMRRLSYDLSVACREQMAAQTRQIS